MVDLTQKAVGNALEELVVLENFPKLLQVAARFDEPEWSPPLYNIWNFAKNTNIATRGSSTFGCGVKVVKMSLLLLACHQVP